MFRTVKLVAGNKLINEKCFLSLFSLSRHNFAPANFATRNYGVKSENVKKDIEFCKLGDIDKFKNLEKEFSPKFSQEKVCKFILKQNIQVPNLIGYSKSMQSINNTHHLRNMLPETVSIGRFDAEEDNAIMRNMENLSKLTQVKSYNEILLMSRENKGLLTKMEIIGSFLSQGIQKIRLPQEVFFRARNLLVLSKGELTEEEKRVIEEHFNSGFRAWKSLGEKLNRDPNTIKTYAFSRYKDKSKRGRFALDETKKIMKAVFKTNKKSLYNSDDVTTSAIIWDELAQELNRPAKHVYYHWLFFIQPLLTRHEAGVLDVDFKIPLLEYCVKSDIQYPQSANWKNISKSPEFFGTTPCYLSFTYGYIRRNTKAAYKLDDKEVTTKVMLERLKSLRSMKRKNKSEEDILDYYENVIKKN